MKLSRICDYCSVHFLRTLKDERKRIKDKCNKSFCSRTCSNLAQKYNNVSCICENCKVSFIKVKSKLSRNNFCCKSCAATYNNKHKKYGIRRSKFEVYVELEFKKEFPNINLLCNSKQAINSELDFYFPDLNLAIEINGIFHYQPIYGQDKLDQIVANDADKLKRCISANIDLKILDISSCKYFSKPNSIKYYNLFKNLVIPYLVCAENANEQAS